jgi:pyruvate,water dikinase
VVIGRFDPDASTGPTVTAGTTVLEGIPVFPGVVTGPARVILLADDHEQVLPGEILIAPFTDPAWTPYFLPAAGVVMDLGGILSHGSIVAREYGLPAVTNVGSATKLVRTGDVVQVDGGRGRVVILERARAKDPVEASPFQPPPSTA